MSHFETKAPKTKSLKPKASEVPEIKSEKFICGACFLVCYSQSDLERHKLTHEAKKTEFHCDICGEVYPRESGMRRHFRHAHPGQDVPIPQDDDNVMALVGGGQPVVILGERVSGPLTIHSVVIDTHDLGEDDCEVEKNNSTGNERNGSDTGGLIIDTQDSGDEECQDEKIITDSEKVSDTGISGSAGMPPKFTENESVIEVTKIFTCRICFNEFSSVDNLSQHLASHYESGEGNLSVEKPRENLRGEETKDFDVDTVDNLVKLPPDQTTDPDSNVTEKNKEKNPDDVEEDGVSTFTRLPKQKNLKDVIGRIGIACVVCEEVFSNASELEHHVKCEHSMNKLHCEICQVEFTQKTNLVCHLKATHREEGSFECDKCSETFLIEYDLLLHRLLHEEDVQRASLSKKKHSKSSASIKCKDCEETFMFKKDMKSHRREAHKQSPLITDQPPIIIQDLVMKEEGRAVNIYKCNLCPRAFNLKSDLMRHFLIHSGEKPFACDLCNNRFNRKSNLVRHKRLMHNVVGVPSMRARSARVREKREWEDEYSDDERPVRKFPRKNSNRRREIWEVEDEQFAEEERRLLEKLIREREWRRWHEENTQEGDVEYEIEDEDADEGTSPAADGQSEMEVTVIEPGDQITVRILTY